ncbi:hypothetical protein [Rathayibacter toxicus]|uniref:Uncharacterized protein n=1 Tax=Rathayibacter toxicus TaxID=145458 RepID=A0A2S5Y5F7_9MICO|nr:hypothetical protein [Rathayibacter toxicus]PPH21812.1 hypothetical protein C5D17_09805 [Rathayibacter toxicus]PPH56242.1 hypothetical protein C5D30_09790 [Rathayibacter toxicus]PPH58338.1 hypothetical protein C5C93_09845 [Rathayibacter toxicus]PPH86085.1 hypothetical protein C5D31_09825 [Rathayibacter toxicus]PPI13969.1 hypothetical protein C5C51_09775 [Rathayibacter toxicus]
MQLGRLLTAQNAVLGLVGSAIGGLVAMPVVPVALDEFVSSTSRFGTEQCSPVCRSAARTSPLEMLRESAPPEPRMSRLRWITAGALAVLLARILNGRRSEIVGLAVLIGPVVAALVAVLGPIIFPRLIFGWTSLVPLWRATLWYLARHSAQHRAVQSSAGILTLLVAISLWGPLVAITETATNWVAITYEVSDDYRLERD